MEDFDLTNLNWVSGTSVPINASVSPPSSKHSLKDSTQPACSYGANLLNVTTPKTPILSESSNLSLNRKRTPCPNIDEHGNKKPICSYSCLIALALKAETTAETGACLPVHEIYKCIEELFPFYKNISDGWKSSVRHNLSLNSIFRKVLRDEGWEGKKGYYWEISPDKMDSIDKEVEKFLAQTGDTIESMRATLMAIESRKKFQQRKESKVKKTPKGTPKKEIKSKEIPSEIAMYSPQMQAQLKKCKTPVTPKTIPTKEVFDTSSTPSQFVGIQTPQSDDIGAAKELFGCRAATNNSPHPGHGEFTPLSTSPAYGMYGFPTMSGFGYGSPSPIVGMSPASSNGTSPIISPPFVQYLPMNMFAPAPYMVDFNHPSNPMFMSPCQRCGYPNQPKIPQGAGTLHNVEEDRLTSKQSSKSKSCGCENRKRKKPASAGPQKKIRKSKLPRQLCFDDIDQDSPLPQSPVSLSKDLKSPYQLQEGTAVLQDVSIGDLIIDCSPGIDPNEVENEEDYINFQGLSKEKMKELEDIVGSTAELDSLFSSGQSSVQTSPDKTSSPLNHQTIRPFEAMPVLECKILAHGKATCNEEQQVHIDATTTTTGVPALSSLLHLGDASIVSIETAMNVTKDSALNHSRYACSI